MKEMYRKNLGQFYKALHYSHLKYQNPILYHTVKISVRYHATYAHLCTYLELTKKEEFLFCFSQTQCL